MTTPFELSLYDHLDHNFSTTRYRKSERIHILSSVNSDLAVGFAVQKISKRGITREYVDIGIRISSVERVYDAYEIDCMRRMGFTNPEPVGWLTFWRPAYDPVKGKDQFPEFERIVRSYSELYAAINADPVRSLRELSKLLSDACRPEWATLPGSSLLVIKALAFRSIRHPDACADASRLIDNVSDMTPDSKANVEAFCHWLRLRQ